MITATAPQRSCDDARRQVAAEQRILEHLAAHGEHPLGSIQGHTGMTAGQVEHAVRRLQRRGALVTRRVVAPGSDCIGGRVVYRLPGQPEKPHYSQPTQASAQARRWRRRFDEQRAPLKDSILALVRQHAPAGGLSIPAVLACYDGPETASDVTREIRRLWAANDLSYTAAGTYIPALGRLSRAAIVEALGYDDRAEIPELEDQAA